MSLLNVVLLFVLLCGVAMTLDVSDNRRYPQYRTRGIARIRSKHNRNITILRRKKYVPGHVARPNPWLKRLPKMKC